MIIEKIHIKSFGMLTDFILEFSPTINVIEGENESGKSTIAAFIRYMLYGFDNDTDKNTLDERNKRINWESKTAEGSMYVRVKDKRYLISRTTARVESAGRISYKEDSSITDLETGTLAFGKVPAGEVFFGVDSALFDNTAYIGQIGDSTICEGSVKESIENILFSGSEKINTQRAASKVSVKMENLLHQGGSGGVIYDLMRRGDELEDGYLAASTANKEILEKEARLHELRALRQDQIDKKERFTDLDFCYRNVQIIQSFDKLHDYEEQYSKKCEEYTAFTMKNTKNGYTPTHGYLSDITLARTGVDNTYRQLNAANENYDRQKSAIGITKDIENAIAISDTMGKEEVVRNNVKTVRHSEIKNVFTLIATSILFVSSLLLEFLATDGFKNTLAVIAFALIGALSLGASVAVASFIYKNKARILKIAEKFSTSSYQELLMRIDVIAAARDKRDKLVKSINDAALAVETAKKNYEDAKITLLETVLRWGEEFPSSNLNAFLDDLETRVRAFLAEDKRLLDERMELEIKVRTLREELCGKSEIDIRAQVPPFKRKVLFEVSRDEILAGISACEDEIREYERLAEIVEDELSELKMNVQDPAILYAKMDQNDSKIEELRTQHRAYYYALKAIEGASDKLREEVSPRLAEFSAELMGIMTNNKYTELTVDDGLNLSFKNYDGEEKTVDYLSRGTRDLSYVSLRMALIDMLYTEKPPVCFDESFAHQDNIRAKSMMEAISHLAKDGYQSIIFTSRQRESNLAKEKDEGAGLIKISRSRPRLV